MTSAASRAVVLAGVALLAGSAALAVSHRRTHHVGAPPPPVGAWSAAVAEPYTPAHLHATGACGVVVGAQTIGVAHPVLPCGAKVYIRFGGKEVLTQVLDRGNTTPGHEFDLTPALARLLGIDGPQTIEWRFAG